MKGSVQRGRYILTDLFHDREKLWIWPEVLFIARARLKAQSCKIHKKQMDNALESSFTCSEMLLKQEWLLSRFIFANTSICTNQKWESLHQWDGCISIMSCKIITVTTALNLEHIKITTEMVIIFGIQKKRTEKTPKTEVAYLFTFLDILS